MLAGRTPVTAQLQALHAALAKIEHAERLVEGILADDAPAGEAERISSIKAEIRCILALIRNQLQH